MGGAFGSRGGDTGGAIGSEETRLAPPDPAQETREVPSDPEEETQEASSDSDEKKRVARLAAGSRDLGNCSYPRVRSSLSATIFRQTIQSRTWSRRVHAGVEGAAPQNILPTIEEVDEESTSICDGGGSMIL